MFLPSVTIYTEIRSSTYGTVTTACPVSVQVLPHFSREASSSNFDPDLELWEIFIVVYKKNNLNRLMSNTGELCCLCRSESGLRNLSALLPLGNSAEIRNYISLLTAILNRLSLEDGSNTRAQRRARNVLICTTCQLESGEQVPRVKYESLFHSSCTTCHVILQESMEDNINILRNLLQVTNQVSGAPSHFIHSLFRIYRTCIPFSADLYTCEVGVLDLEYVI